MAQAADPAASPPQGGVGPARGWTRSGRGLPCFPVWGGKITTFRKLAEEAADLLAAPLNLRQGAWTAGTTLPGGDLAPSAGGTGQGGQQSSDVVGDFARFAQALSQRHPAIPAEVVPAAGALLRLARGGALIGKQRPGPGNRQRPLRSRTELPARARMGSHRGRRALAPHQARPAHERRPARNRGRLVQDALAPQETTACN